MLSRAGNYFCNNFKLTTNLVSNQYHGANPAPKSTVLGRKIRFVKSFPLVAESHNLTLFVYKPCDVVFVLF